MSLGFKRNIAEEFAIKFTRLLLDLLFAWGISIVICLSGNFAALVASTSSRIFPVEPPDLISALIPILQYGVGAFCFGTLAKKTNMWLLTALFVSPLLLLVPSSGTTLQELSRSLGSVALCFFGSLCAIAAGQSTQFHRDKAVLDIPWYHWLWLFPTSLFQAVCVPLTLLFAFIQLDAIYAVAEARPTVRLMLGILLPLCLMIVYNAGRILGRSGKLTILEKIALVFTWLLLTIPQVLFTSIQMGKDMMN
jgi:hypothetical protein